MAVSNVSNLEAAQRRNLQRQRRIDLTVLLGLLVGLVAIVVGVWQATSDPWWAVFAFGVYVTVVSVVLGTNG